MSKQMVNDKATHKTAGKQNTGHIHGLDGLRAVAILGVILFHLFPAVVKGGYLGVCLLFVISGFLLTVTCEDAWQNGAFIISKFYKKRLKRIYPALLIVMVITLCIITLFLPEMLRGIRHEIGSVFGAYNNWWQIAQNASYFARMTELPVFTHLWSLAIELQYYLIWPLLFFTYKLLCRKLPLPVSACIFLLAAIASAYMMYSLYDPYTDTARAYYGTDTRCFSLLFGSYLGALYHRKDIETGTDNKVIWSVMFTVIGAAVLIILYLFMEGQSAFTYRGGMVIASLFFTGLIALVSNPLLPIGKWVDNPVLSWIGKRSYEIFLFYFPVMVIYQKLLKTPTDVIHPLIQTAIIFVLAAAVHYFINAVFSIKATGRISSERNQNA